MRPIISCLAAELYALRMHGDRQYYGAVDFPFLEKTSLWNALSRLGKSVSTPKGIFYWGNRARTEAEIDGSVGIAQDDDGTISHLSVAGKWAGDQIMKQCPRGKIFGYAPIEGLPSLREKWRKKMLERWPNLASCASLPVVTNGITHSLALAARLLLESGQTIVTADKSWENYEHIFFGVQGISITQFALFDAKSELNIDGLISACEMVAVKQKKVVLLFNFPHNQTGFMPNHETCRRLGEAIRELCKRNETVPFVVILDDAYEGYVYDDGGQCCSLLGEIFAQLPNLSVAKLDGISKVMLAYGYRVAFLTFFLNRLDGAVFSDEFLKGMQGEVGTKIGGLIRGEISQVNHHGQVLADGLMDEWDEVSRERGEVISRLKDRYLEMMRALEQGFTKYGKNKMWADPCNGGFFAHLNLSKEMNPRDIADQLIVEKKVGVVPSLSGIRVAFSGVPKLKIARLIEAIFGVVYE